jgi:Skp family chaperone for outer membrane proteins
MNKSRSFALAALAASGALFALLGFQQGQERTGTVNISQLIQKSSLGQKNTQRLESAFRRRQNFLAFLEQNPLMERAQVDQLKSLELKETLTTAETEELTRLKAAAAAALREFNELNMKTAPTDADRQKLDIYNERSRAMAGVIEGIANEFNQDVQKLRDEVRQNETSSSQKAIQEAAKRAGVTIVFNAEVAPYAANDLTEEAVKIMNATP